MLPTSVRVEPATSWSPVGRRIQLSHQGRLTSWYVVEMGWCVLTLKMPRKSASENVVCFCRLLNILANFFKPIFWIQANSVDQDQTAPEGAVWSGSTLFAGITFKVAGRRHVSVWIWFSSKNSYCIYSQNIWTPVLVQNFTNPFDHHSDKMPSLGTVWCWSNVLTRT